MLTFDFLDKKIAPILIDAIDIGIDYKEITTQPSL